MPVICEISSDAASTTPLSETIIYSLLLVLGLIIPQNIKPSSSEGYKVDTTSTDSKKPYLLTTKPLIVLGLNRSKPFLSKWFLSSVLWEKPIEAGIIALIFFPIISEAGIPIYFCEFTLQLRTFPKSLGVASTKNTTL